MEAQKIIPIASLKYSDKVITFGSSQCNEISVAVEATKNSAGRYHDIIIISKSTIFKICSIIVESRVLHNAIT